jgi:hypothetical protein
LVDIETFFQEKNAGRIKGEGKLQKKKINNDNKKNVNSSAKKLFRFVSSCQ